MLALSHCFQKGLGTFVRGLAVANDIVFKRSLDKLLLLLENMLETVLEEKKWNYYDSLVSATSDSLLYGYLETYIVANVS